MSTMSGNTLEHQWKAPCELRVQRICWEEVAREAHPARKCVAQSICYASGAHHSAASLRRRDLGLVHGNCASEHTGAPAVVKRPTRNMTISYAPPQNAPPTIRIPDPSIMLYLREYRSQLHALKRHPKTAPALLTPLRAPMILVVCSYPTI